MNTPPLNNSPVHAERMQRFTSAGIYFVTSQSMSEGRSTLEIIEAALRGGIRLVQLREKDLSREEYLALASEARELTSRANAILMMNDYIDVALEVNADGVHLGQDDMDIDEARKLGPDLIIGSSTHNIEEAVEAEALGASYINIGPIFPTNTKLWTDDYLGLELLTEISSHVNIPFTVMGGIKEHHIPDLKSVGANTIALVTAITAADDPEAAARQLLKAM